MSGNLERKPTASKIRNGGMARRVPRHSQIFDMPQRWELRTSSVFTLGQLQYLV